ncbi:hypothetical protein KC366_g17836, partial [Hortaea werneckii]
MALQEVTSAFLRRFRPSPATSCPAWNQQCRRYATEITQETSDLEQTEFVDGSSSKRAFDPAATARRRNRRLPSSRYQFRDP